MAATERTTREGTSPSWIGSSAVIWGAAAVAAFTAWGWWTSVPVPPADFWWHVGVGRDILAGDGIPVVDTYSWVYTGAPFFDQPWLAQVLYAALHDVGGLPLTVFATGLALGLTGALLHRACTRASHGNARVAAVVLVAAGIPAMTENWLVRPQTLAYPLFAAMLALVLDRRFTRNRPLYALLVMAAWTNIHGSFVLGIVLAGAGTVVAVGEAALHRRSVWAQVRAPGAILLAALAGTFANPRGPMVYGYVRNLTTNDAVREVVSEWAPTDLTTLSGRILALLVVVTLLAMLLHRHRPDPLQSLLAVGFLVLALTAGRHVVWFAMSLMPLLTAAFGAGSASRSRAPGTPTVILIAAVILVAAVASLPWLRSSGSAPGLPPLATGVPSAATMAALEQIRPQRLFNESGYGSYLIAHDVRVFFDPRFEFYPAQHVREYYALSRGEGVDESTDRWRFDAMLVSKSLQPGLAKELRGSPKWAAVAEDADALLLVTTVAGAASG